MQARNEETLHFPEYVVIPFLLHFWHADKGKAFEEGKQ